MPNRGTLPPFELCRRVLDRFDGELDRLLAKAGRAETHWLEFKAACEPPRLEAEPGEAGESADDWRWNLARAVIALANTDGGCVLLGVNDDGEAVGLESSDPSGILQRQGMDAFLRHLEDAVIRRPKGWSLSGGRRVILDGSLPEGTIEYRRATLGGKPVVAILVKPPSAGEICLHCKEEAGGKRRHFLPIRQGGQVGRVRELEDPKDMYRWQRERGPAADLSELWRKMEPGGADRRRVLAAAAAAVAALVALAAFFLRTQPPPPPPQPEIALIDVRSVEIRFQGNRESLSQPAVRGVAEKLASLSPVDVKKKERFSGVQGWFSRFRRSKDAPRPDSSSISFDVVQSVVGGDEPDRGPGESASRADALGWPYIRLVLHGASGLVVEIAGDLKVFSGVEAGEIEREVLEALKEQGIEVD